MDFAVDLVATIIGLGIFAQHIWALKGHFASSSMTDGARTISIGAVASFLFMQVPLWWFEQPLAATVVGIAVMVGSLFLFWAAVRASRSARLRFAFDSALPQQLVTTGPYSRIRHPFYTSYLLYWTGWAIAIWSAWGLVPVVVMAALYTIAARYEEQLLGASDMAAAYAEYRQRAGLFWPKL